MSKAAQKQIALDRYMPIDSLYWQCLAFEEMMAYAPTNDPCPAWADEPQVSTAVPAGG